MLKTKDIERETAHGYSCLWQNSDLGLVALANQVFNEQLADRKLGALADSNNCSMEGFLH